jgi:uncharacterized caspase-like protein
MANQWALLIGINQYTALPPLMYAQADAVGLRNFFVDEVGMPIDRCVLLSDLSAAIEPYAHYPTAETLRSQLTSLCETHVQPGDTLWVFFSGYGLQSAGEDYLLPLDGDPTRLEETALSATWLLNSLKAAKTDHILLALDMNRSQGALGRQNLGQQTAALAKDFGIPLLLACQPQQASHETMAVRHGLFGQALLEGMRYHGCVTVAQLAAYVGDRVPELSQHHWRPPQDPVAVIPAAQKFMMVLPAEAVTRLPMTEKAAAASTEAVSAPPEPTSALAIAPESASADTPSVADEAVAPPTSPPAEGDGAEAGTSSSALWNWGLAGAALVLLLGVFWRYQPMLRNAGPAPEVTDSAASAPDMAASAPAESVPTDAAPAESGPGASPEPADLQPTPENLGTAPATAPEPTPQESALQRAEAAIAAQRYGEARAWLALVPIAQQDERYEQLRQQVASGTAQAAERNQALLAEARRQIQPVSASVFNDAIETARQIPPGDPYYEQAQVDIDRWSQIILDLAEGRAATGDINGAIAAAQLVPADRPALYRQAQENIARWQQQSANQRLIQQAQASLQPGQASSFQKAIAQLQQITPDQPEYPTARDRIVQWSEDILVIARARAAQSRFSEAIAAAQLVPNTTPIHAQAQTEIQRWQSQI